eukprot:1820262-Amphidinium_carterae.1
MARASLSKFSEQQYYILECLDSNKLKQESSGHQDLTLKHLAEPKSLTKCFFLSFNNHYGR